MSHTSTAHLHYRPRGLDGVPRFSTGGSEPGVDLPVSDVGEGYFRNDNDRALIAGSVNSAIHRRSHEHCTFLAMLPELPKGGIPLPGGRILVYPARA